jgi:hypothetical protein
MEKLGSKIGRIWTNGIDMDNAINKMYERQTQTDKEGRESRNLKLVASCERWDTDTKLGFSCHGYRHCGYETWLIILWHGWGSLWSDDDTTRRTEGGNMIWYAIFNCNWVATRWQQFSTHIHTRTIQRTSQDKQYTEQHKNARYLYKKITATSQARF